jgi:hypothetical protein
MRHFVDLFHLVLVFGGVGRHARLAKCKVSLKVVVKNARCYIIGTAVRGEKHRVI